MELAAFAASDLGRRAASRIEAHAPARQWRKHSRADRCRPPGDLGALFPDPMSRERPVAS